MLDIDRMEIPAVALVSEEFESGVASWSDLHGFDPAVVYVRHPIQPLNEAELRGRAEDIVDAVIGALTRT